MEYFLVLLFLLTSGAKFWVGTLSPAGAFMLFFIFSLYYHLRRHRYKVSLNRSFLFILFVMIWSICSLVLNGMSMQDNSMLGYIVCMMGTYLMVSSFHFVEFRRKLTNVTYWICLIGIPIFGLNELGLLPAMYRTFGDTTYKLFGPFTLGWPNDFHRFTGLWHEAGACQIILNSVLWLHFDNISRWTWKKGELRKLMVILAGSLVTLSTGSYMCLMLLGCAVVMNLKIKSRNKALIYLGVLVVAAAAIVLMFNSSVVQNKLFADEESVSLLERTSDIIAFWTMAIQKPLFGYGVGTSAFWTVSTQLGNTANSSGVMTYLASLGFVWLLMFLVSVWKGVSKVIRGKARLFMLAAVVLMQFNECFIEYPITNMFIFFFMGYGAIYVRKRRIPQNPDIKK